MEDLLVTPPKHLLVVCNPKADSFSMAIARRYEETADRLGQQVVVRDLYRLGFDPILKASEEPSDHFAPAPDVVAELAAIDGADVLVLIYPLWFGMPPALLKGYVDRVLGAGVSFRSVEQRLPHALLNGTRLVSFTSSGTRQPWLEEQGAWLSLRKLFDDYLCHAFSMHSSQHVHFGSVVQGLKPRFVAEHLYKVEQTARQLCSALLRAALLAKAEKAADGSADDTTLRNVPIT
jgi:NAD(P)H dehydrogenase (quinone)